LAVVHGCSQFVTRVCTWGVALYKAAAPARKSPMATATYATRAVAAYSSARKIP